MKVFFILVSLVFLTLAVGIPLYLGPDDLMGCDLEKPGTNNRCRTADAIVAVSGGDTAARTEEAIALYKAGWAPKLIFSGAALDPTAPSNALVMKRLAIRQGVPTEAIEIEEEARTTYENAFNTKTLAEAGGVSDVILVTSAYHQRRASLEFKEEFKDTITLRNHPVARDKQWRVLWWVTPSGWWLVGGELAKIVGFYTGASEL